MTLADRTRLDQWAHFEKAKHLSGTVTLLGIYFDSNGTCEAEVFADDRNDPIRAGALDELLTDHVSGLFISVGIVFYELEGRLNQLG